MSAADGEEHLVGLRNEVLRRVGRNLLLFQQIELLMKFLVANASIETGPSGLTASEIARQEAIKRKTLGPIRSQFFDELFAEPVESSTSEPVAEFRIRFSFRLSPIEGDQFRRYQETFEKMTDERNDLVHHFLQRYRLTEGESLEAASVSLDEQRERVLPLREGLVRLHDELLEGRKAMAAYMESKEGSAEIDLMTLQNSRIVTLLAHATQLRAREDGWTLLSVAGDYIASQDPEQLPSIKRRFGHRGLQSLVAASELFELQEEPTENGRIRVTYRIKPGAIEFV